MNAATADIIPQDWRHWSSTRPTVSRPLAGGLTNQSFLLAAGSEQLVLRINSPISAALDLNRTAEEQAMRLVSRAGLCAPLVYCDPKHRYLVTRYVAGKKWSANTGAAMPRLAQLLRCIHRLPAIAEELDIERKIASYWRSIAPGYVYFPLLKSLENKVLQHTAAARSLSEGSSLCHNDLLPENLISSAEGGLLAIDWEYAATGDPFYDLAVIAQGHGLDEDQQEQLLTAYLQRDASAPDQQRLYHWRVIYAYLSLLWYAVQHASGAMQGAPLTDGIKQDIDALCDLMATGHR